MTYDSISYNLFSRIKKVLVSEKVEITKLKIDCKLRKKKKWKGEEKIEECKKKKMKKERSIVISAQYLEIFA